jgi:hypothetical protein
MKGPARDRRAFSFEDGTPAVKQKKKPKPKPKPRNPVARALRHAKPKVEEQATAYSRKRLKKPATED